MVIATRVIPIKFQVVDMVPPDSGELLGRKGEVFAASKEKRVFGKVRHSITELRWPPRLRCALQLMGVFG